MIEDICELELVSLSDFGKSSLNRIIVIFSLLQAGFALSAKDVAEKFGISIRSAYRDLEKLRALGIPFKHDEGFNMIDLDQWSLWIRPLSHAWIAGTNSSTNNGKTVVVKAYSKSIVKC